MAVMRKDKHSGALIFDLTPSELEVRDLKDTVEELMKEMKAIKETIATNTDSPILD